MSSATRFCQNCGLEAPLAVLFGAVNPPCVMCHGTKYVKEEERRWDLKIDNEYDRVFLKVNRISPK